MKFADKKIPVAKPKKFNADTDPLFKSIFGIFFISPCLFHLDGANLSTILMP
jgi:hypothetical protein